MYLRDPDGNILIADDTTTTSILVLEGENVVFQDDDAAVVVTETSSGDPVTVEVPGNRPFWGNYTVGTVDVTVNDL